jgi:Domain of unknown function (DUF1707)
VPTRTITSTVLVSDLDRELAAAALRRHFACGRLSLGELSERVDLALRARSRADLDTSLKGLPLVWEDMPAIVHTAAHRVQRGVRWVRFLIVLVRAWSKLSIALALAFVIALVAGAPLTAALGAFLAVWALASFATWRVCRRTALRP